MTCHFCHVSSDEDVCKICLYLTEVPPARHRFFCEQCAAPIAMAEPKERLCQLCTDLLQTLRNSVWFVRAHMEWEQENTYLARRKMKLLGQSGPFA
jgi:hypothetical protein